MIRKMPREEAAEHIQQDGLFVTIFGTRLPLNEQSNVRHMRNALADLIEQREREAVEEYKKSLSPS